MKIIKDLSEMIEDELDGAEEYIEYATKIRMRHPTLARVFAEISAQEMTHVNRLHEEVTKLIAEHRKEHGEPPVAMQAVYDYLHERHTDKANKIKMLQASFRGE